MERISARRKRISPIVAMCLFTGVLVVFSFFFGVSYGWVKDMFTITLISTDPPVLIHLKAVSLFSYSLLALAVGSLLYLKEKLFRKISYSTRIALGSLILIPEAIALYELIWNFAFWTRFNLVDSDYFVFTTKFATITLFFLLGLQILLFLKGEKPHQQ